MKNIIKNLTREYNDKVFSRNLETGVRFHFNNEMEAQPLINDLKRHNIPYEVFQTKDFYKIELNPIKG